MTWFLTRNIAVEVGCCITNHKIQGTGFLSGLAVARKWTLPATVMLQYHFTNFGAFQPYVGVGVNFSTFHGGSTGGNWQPFLAPSLGFAGFNTITSLQVGSSWGVAGQVGFDYMLNDRWGVNFDLKRVMMRPDAYATVFNTATGAFIPVRAKVNVDPWVASVGVTYRFGGSSEGAVVARY